MPISAPIMKSAKIIVNKALMTRGRPNKLGWRPLKKYMLLLPLTKETAFNKVEWTKSS